MKNFFKAHRVLTTLLVVVLALGVVGVGADALWAPKTCSTTGKITVTPIPVQTWAISTTTIDFGNTTVQTGTNVNIPVSINVQNTGTQPINSLTITQTGSLPQGLTITVSNLPAALAPGDTGAVTFTLTGVVTDASALGNTVIPLDGVTFTLQPGT